MYIQGWVIHQTHVLYVNTKIQQQIILNLTLCMQDTVVEKFNWPDQIKNACSRLARMLDKMNSSDCRV